MSKAHADELPEQADVGVEMQVRVRHDPEPTVSVGGIWRIAPVPVDVVLVAGTQVGTQRQIAGAARVERDELVPLPPGAGPVGGVAQVGIVLVVSGVVEFRRPGLGLRHGVCRHTSDHQRSNDYDQTDFTGGGVQGERPKEDAIKGRFQISD
jgi:hypothetical protein